jgi:hypothetical protein
MSQSFGLPASLVLVGLILMCPSSAAQKVDVVAAPTEKQLRADYKKGVRKKDPALRIEAVVNYSNATRELEEEGGAEKLVAKTLAGALDDDDMGVCNSAMSALAYGRHVETVIDACDETLEYLRNIMEKTSTRPDEESRAQYRGALDVYRVGCAVLGNYKDDRSIDVLETELRALRPGSGIESIARKLVQPVVSALLELRSVDAVEIVIKQTAVYSASTLGGSSPQEKVLEAMARNLHDALVSFAVDVERAPPAFTKNYQQDWHKWFKEHKKLFLAKLGKLKQPPGPIPYQRPGMMDNPRSSNRPQRP